MYFARALCFLLSPALAFTAAVLTAHASEIDDISKKCELADAAQSTGNFDEAEKNLIDALQLSWKVPLTIAKQPSTEDTARVAAMSQEQKIALANKEYSDSLSEVVVMAVPMALGELCSSYEKAGRYDKVVEIHEWLVKNAEHLGGSTKKIDIAINQVLMAKAALQEKKSKTASEYYSRSMADEKSLQDAVNSGQFQNFAVALKEYSELLRANGSLDDASKVLKRSQEFTSLAGGLAL